ncbi:hypothetical protein KR009_002048 [Drosophila setifemur]|nr:hypothetical protein KR009_002048 [Drosophila setifemur]
MNRLARQRNYYYELEELWQKEIKIIKKIFEDPSQLDSKVLMELHNYVYVHCNSFVNKISVRNQDPGNHFYTALNSFVEDRLRVIIAELEVILVEEQLLVAYASHWEPYRKSCEKLDMACRYLNQTWVKKERMDWWRLETHEVYRTAMIRWKEIVFSHLHKNWSLVKAITLMVHQKKHSNLIYQVLKSIVELYANEEKQTVPVPNKLNNVFEDAVVIFFQKETLAESLVDAITLVVHQKKHSNLIYQVLKSIVELYANDANQAVSVPNKLNNVFEDAVVIFFQRETLAEFQKILASNVYTEFKHFLKYACLAMPEIEEGEYCTKAIKTRVATELVETIGKISSSKGYVQAILGPQQSLLAKAIKDHKQLLAAIDRACEDAVNKDSTINRKLNPPDLLARYCHELMTRKVPSGEEVENELKRIANVVEYLYDKDLFIKRYLHRLIMRQVKETSVSDEHESLMVSLLTKKFGVDVTKKLLDQLEEIGISNNVLEHFNTHLADKGINLSFDFRLKFFSNSKFAIDKSGLILPWEMQKPVEAFLAYCKSQYSSRKVEFNYGVSSGEVTWYMGQTSYLIEASTFQMALLLQFNQKDRFTVVELTHNMGINLETLEPELKLLVQGRILTCSEPLNMSAYVDVCNNFVSRKRHLNVHKTAAKKSKVQDKMDQLSKVQRNHLITAAVMRIMKKMKTLKHPQLVQMVIDELKNLFRPEIRDIKEAIERLLNAPNDTYIERSEDNYVYIN